MGFLDKFFKKKITEPEMNYEEIIFKSWDIFRQGLKNPNPKIRLAVEKTVWYLDSPEGKRFFATGMQEPDLSNKAFCLKRLYERGGWRLAENILKIAFDPNELDLKSRENMIYYIGGFSDPNAVTYLIKGLESKETEIRIATISALSGVKSGESMNLVDNHLQDVTNELEKFVSGILLYQYNHPNGKKIIDDILKFDSSPEYIDKLRYLDFNKTKTILESLVDKTSSENKKVIISMIEDNRGIDLLKSFLKDSDFEIINKAIEKIIENGSRSALEEIKKLSKIPQTEKNIEYALAAFNDKNSLEVIEKRIKESELTDNIIDDLKTIGLVYEQDIAGLIDKLILPFDNLDTLNDNQMDKLLKAIQLLIKYGKISSIILLKRYLDFKYLESEDIKRWNISCYSAAAILCIVERNTTYYTLRKKIKEEQGLK